MSAAAPPDPPPVAVPAPPAARPSTDGEPEPLTRERTRIAGELGDIVAHAVTALSVCAGAAERQLQDDDGPARESVRAVRLIANEAMADLRRMQAVLHAGPPGYAPQPGLAELPALADAARRRGVEATVDVVGDVSAVPRSVAVSVHRIVEAVLRAAAVEDPASRVRVVVTSDALVLRVSPGGAGAPDDAYDRVRLHRGRLARDGHGDLVVTLPLGDGR
jgi:signal transduction histidine kinase